MDFKDRPVFEFAIDWNRQPSARFEYDLRKLQIGFGPPQYAPLQADVVRGWRFHLLFPTPDERAAFDAFVTALKGRLAGFWFPAPEQAFRITAFVGVTEETTEFDIQAQGLAGTWQEHPARFLYFQKPGQDAQAAEITAVLDNGDGTERVTVAPEISEIDETWSAFALHYVRLGDDLERASVIAEGVEEREVRLIELPPEYAAIEAGVEPIYRYHFWADFNGTVRHWYFTSYYADVATSTETYTAAPINHRSFRQSTRSETEELTVEALYDPANPLSLLFPLKMSVPLWIEVLETTALEPNSTTVLFSGLVLSTSVQGKKQTARCASAMDALRGGVPGMIIQPRCNYRLFETNTCRLNKNDFDLAVTIDELSGRYVTVAGAGLVGKEQNHFAEGWIQTGTEGEFEVRTILVSGAEADGKVILMLNAPFSFAAVGAAATVYPGCDGRDETCTTKFGNFVNWGGHRVPLKNLTLKALEISMGSGGKK